MSPAIIADLVKALEEARHEGFEELHPDLLNRIDTVLARAKQQLDLDKARIVTDLCDDGERGLFSIGIALSFDARKEPVKP